MFFPSCFEEIIQEETPEEEPSIELKEPFVGCYVMFPSSDAIGKIYHALGGTIYGRLYTLNHHLVNMEPI